MQEFLEKLYNYEYFGIYLMISIAVLVLLFIIVLFFGKKDKKVREIEATKKLQLEQANTDAFKVEDNQNNVEVSTTLETPVPTENVEPQPSEVTPSVDVTTPNLESDTLVFPTINMTENDNEPEEIKEEIKSDLNTNDDVAPIKEYDLHPSEPTINDMIAPMAELSQNEEENVMSSEPVDDFAKVEMPLENEPILNKVEEKPFAFNNELEESQNDLFSNVEVPEFNFDNLNTQEPVEEEVKVPSKNIDVFSSVFAPKREENIDLPEINNGEVKPEEREEVSVPSADEMEIELPTLKKEVVEEHSNEKIEKPILKDYNLDDITGETYNINN